MGKEDKTVFISYRRKVSWSTALLIYQDLEKHGWDVFMDVKSIDSGKFEPIILRQIGARKHFLVILEAGTLDRAVSSSDWLRREIEEAINLKRNVVPLMTENFSLSEAERFLKGDLMKQLPDLNGITLRHEYFNAGMKRLRKRFMKAPSDITIKPTPAKDLLDIERIKKDFDWSSFAGKLPKLRMTELKAEYSAGEVRLEWDCTIALGDRKDQLQLSFSPSFNEPVMLYDGKRETSYVDKCKMGPLAGHTRYYRLRHSGHNPLVNKNTTTSWSEVQSVVVGPSLLRIIR